MRRGKCVGKSHRYRGKLVLALFAMILTLCCLTGGTLAWLTSTIEPVSNTFVIGSISATSSDSTGVFNANSAVAISNASDGITYVPGQVIEADPVITIAAGSEACYVFIHIDEENNSIGEKKIVNWNLNNPDGIWTNVNGYDGYYYTCLDKISDVEDKCFHLLADKKLTVNEELSKNDVTSMSAAYPSFTISAAIVQAKNIPDSNNDGAIDWQDAWKLLPDDFTENSGN